MIFLTACATSGGTVRRVLGSKAQREDRVLRTAIRSVSAARRVSIAGVTDAVPTEARRDPAAAQREAQAVHWRTGSSLSAVDGVSATGRNRIAIGQQQKIGYELMCRPSFAGRSMRLRLRSCTCHGMNSDIPNSVLKAKAAVLNDFESWWSGTFLLESPRARDQLILITQQMLM